MILFLLGISGFLFLLYMYIEAHRNRVRFQSVKVDKLPSSFNHFKIFFISDIHKRTIQEEIIEKIGKADIVLIGGDLVEKGVKMNRVQNNLKMLSKIGPVYFVWGNNDYDVDIDELQKVLMEEGTLILDNSFITLIKGDGAVDFVGVNDTSLRKDRLQDAVAQCTSSCRILISHNPVIINKIKKEHGICLVLSGHTHGGQIRLGPFGIAKKGGWYDYKSYQLLISNGFGATHLPLRLGAPCESHLITLSKK
ncbi:metallophosphoesterase [Fictibacillus nanhaiensis]|uniref:metallophosphoesterase n=1 Tax=Fictibacillus nanhaiensis TaxID=742169 RepID=UPI001C94B811|nr:metallophosphoesterase [Fictibacillus nanhaiensis]MBY6035663.1 metallophosphoesterase [Fictibacillus nanhaiensis]